MNETCTELARQSAVRCRDCAIRPAVFLADLERQDFALFQQPVERLELDAGQPLYRHGDAPDNVFLVRDGLVKLVQYLPNGDQRIVRLLRWGDLAGLETLLGQPYQHSAIALEPVSACRLPVKILERVNRETPRLHQQLLAQWEQTVREADTWLTALSTGPAQVRMARMFRHLVGSHPDRICHLPPREDVGAMLGITMETASRITAEFRRKGVIERLDSRHVRVDLEALGRLEGH